VLAVRRDGVARAIGALLRHVGAGGPPQSEVPRRGRRGQCHSVGAGTRQTQQANELGFRSTFGFVNNEYVGAVAAGYLLSDDPYGDPDPPALLGGYLYVPKLALGRLVETPADITSQVTAYIASNGLANPQTSSSRGTTS